MHGDRCEGIWCLVGEVGPVRSEFRARCGRCGLVALSRAGFASVDRAAFEQAVDPDGLQRAFLAACASG